MILDLMKHIKTVLYKDIIRRKKITPTLIFISFLISFTLARLMVLMFPNFNITKYFIYTYHVHHFFFGVILLSFSNWMAIVSDDKYIRRWSAIIFGFGLGLIVDEIGLFLTCGTSGLICDYYSRITYDFVVWIVIGFLTIIFFEPVRHIIYQEIKKIIRFFRIEKN